jgi:N utilization substance protein B
MVSKGSRHRARMAAVQALYQWDLTEQPPDQIENHFIHDHDLADADQVYFHLLVREVPLHLHELDDYISPHLGRDLDGVDPVERAILRIGVYELEFQQDVPYKVVINEAVELAKLFGAEHSYRFVNGALDKIALQLRSGEIKG